MWSPTTTRAANNRALTIVAGDGGVQFLGRVGTTATNSLADLDATGGFIWLQGNVTVDDQGANTLTFTGQVSLAANVTIDVDGTGTADNHIVFGGRISEPPSTPRRNLTIVAGGANLTFNGIVGDPSTTLDQFTVTSAGVVDFNQAVVANNIAITATTTNIASTITALTDDVTITGNVVLDGNVTITTGGGAGDDFTVTGTVGADDSVGPQPDVDGQCRRGDGTVPIQHWARRECRVG